MSTHDYDSNDGGRVVVSGQIISNTIIEIADVVFVRKKGEETLLRVLDVYRNSIKVIDKDEEDASKFFEIEFNKVFSVLKREE
jgi:hypothetical protein